MAAPEESSKKIRVNGDSIGKSRSAARLTDADTERDRILELIKEHLAQGDTESAREIWREFTQRYPRYPMPADWEPMLSP